MSNPYALGMREKGSTVAASIGTALAVEAALGIHPEHPESPAPIERYSAIWFNMATLFRNLYGSMSADDQKGIVPSELVSALKEDMAVAEQALKAVKPELDVVFYWNTYKSLPRKYSHAKLKQPSTELQKTYALLERDTHRAYVAHPAEVAFEAGDVGLKGSPRSTLVVTHYVVDLLSRYSFQRLDLLESHTGAIKPPAQWSGKLGLDKDDARHMPFNAFTLQIYGDRATQFMAQPHVLRKVLLQLAKDDGWTSVSTMDRVKTSISNTKDAYLMVATRPFL